MEHDPSLIEKLRVVTGLRHLGGQHVRIQINKGFGGSYTMHTDQGTAAGGAGQTLMLTALFYLNPDWEEGDGGELRIFPYPHPNEKIPPREGRAVLFEPRMVHDVLPNYKKRFCFTLWCNQKGNAFSNKIDHDLVRDMEVSHSLLDASAIPEAWRRAERIPLAYEPARLPAAIRHLFLPEMRTWLVRAAHMADELRQVAHSHVDGEGKDAMVRGISGHHDAIRAANPDWALDMLHQLPAARGVAGPAGSGGGEGSDAVGMAELRALVHDSNPWWL